MNVFIAFALFALVILLYWVISELFTILFRFTGLPYGKARFQVTSLLTGCGFTTRESEIVISTRSRRRLARITMLFGYVFSITIVTSLINVILSFKQAPQATNLMLGILIPLAALAVIILFIRVPAMRTRSDRILEKIAGKVLNIEATNSMVVLDHIGRNAIVRVTLVNVPEALKGIPLFQSGLKEDKGILIMLVEKKGQHMQHPKSDTMFEDGDRITVFGDYSAICKTFDAKETFIDEPESD